MEFENLNLKEALSKNLKNLGYSTLTEVQSQAILPALEGKDLLVLSPTGTGKTGAYSIPLLNSLLSSDASALVLVPTRDLGLQVYQFLSKLTKDTSITPVLIVGGVSPQSQFRALKTHLKNSKKNSQLIIGTPGRVLHFSNLGMLPSVDFLVLDEVDRMLDLGFKKDLHSIVSKFTPKPQTLLFSATLPKTLIPLTHFYLKDPVSLDLSTPDRLASTITEQSHFPTSRAQKQELLLSTLKEIEGSKIVFTNRKCDTVSLSKFLSENDVPNQAFSGDLSQGKRAAVLRKFLKKQFQILVCTDLASRGLDIKDLSCVINYQLPVCAHDYMHRVGRTGRNGASGLAINLIGPQDLNAWKAIEKFKKTNQSTEYVKKDKASFSKSNNSFSRKGPRSFTGRSNKPYKRF